MGHCDAYMAKYTVFVRIQECRGLSRCPSLLLGLQQWLSVTALPKCCVHSYTLHLSKFRPTQMDRSSPRPSASTGGNSIPSPGVEMEALTAVQVGLLTIYDMCKAVDRGMVMEGVRLLEKQGGKSGHWVAPA